MKIALIAPQPFADVRGTSIANLRLVQVLAAAGHEVDVITYPFGHTPECPGVEVHRCGRIPLVRSVRIGLSAAKLLMDISLAWCAFQQLRATKYDCIHGVEEGVFIGLLAARGRVPVVYDMDSVMSHEIAAGAMGRFPPAVWLARALERWAIRRAALVVTISEGMADYVRQVNPSQEIAVVPDLPLPFPPGGANPDRARAQLPDEFIRGRKIIVYTGSFAAYQGLDLLVKAMAGVTARVPEAALVIVGGDERSIKRLRGIAIGAGVMRDVVFMGKKTPDQVLDFLSMADMLASPRRGGINPPGKIYTYMQSGTPIVATDIPAHTAVLSQDAAILVEPTEDGIARGILEALAHPEEAVRKAIRAQEIVRGITPDLQASRIRAGYERLAAKIEGRGMASE